MAEITTSAQPEPVEGHTMPPPGCKSLGPSLRVAFDGLRLSGG